MQKERRDFIKTLGVLGAGGAVLANQPAWASMAEWMRTENGVSTIQILQSTDVHCQVHAHDELYWENNQAVFRKSGGYAHMATYFKQQRKTNPNTFVIDTGDMFQGSALSVNTTGQAITPILNALKYDLYIPGNWEVIYYKKRMEELMGNLNAPTICANMFHDLGQGQIGSSIFKPYHIWETAGIKIGFLSYTDPLVPIRQSPNYSKGIIYTAPEDNLQYYVKELREEKGCAFVILLAHLGLSQQIHLSNIPECQGVDYIFGGDTHERVRKPIIGTYAKVVEPGAFGSFVGKLELKVNDGKVIAEQYELVEIDAEKMPADAETEAVIQANEAPFRESIYPIVGYSTIPLYRYFVVENPIDTMILDALKWKITNVDIVLSNGFRFCPPRSTPDQTGNIPITEGFIYDMLPVDSFVRMGVVTGYQLQAWLEKELNNVFAKEAKSRFGGWVIKFKGMEITFNAFSENGKRVQSVTVGGKALDLTKEYRIAACERDGDPEDMLCRIRGVKNTKNTPFTLHQVMHDYLKVNSPVTPTPPLAAKILDAPQTLLSQVFGVDYEFK